MEIEQSYIVRAKNDSCRVAQNLETGCIQVSMITLETVGELVDFAIALGEVAERLAPRKPNVKDAVAALDSVVNPCA